MKRRSVHVLTSWRPIQLPEVYLRVGGRGCIAWYENLAAMMQICVLDIDIVHRWMETWMG